MSSLLTKLKQLFMRDVLPLRSRGAKEIFSEQKKLEWTPYTFISPFLNGTENLVQEIWPILLAEGRNVLFNPSEFYRAIKTLNYLMHPLDIGGDLRDWKNLSLMLEQLVGEDLGEFQHLLWVHHELTPAPQRQKDLKLWMGLDMHQVDFDASETVGRMNRWLYRSSDEITTKAVEGSSGWFWLTGRSSLKAQLGSEYLVRTISDAPFFLPSERTIHGPQVQILGPGEWRENEAGQGCRLSIQSSELDLIIWKSTAPEQNISDWWKMWDILKEEELSLDIRLPSLNMSQTHRMRKPMIEHGLGGYFDPEEKVFSSSFHPKAVWLEELLMVTHLSIQAAPSPNRLQNRAEKQLILDQPFGIMIREPGSKLPLNIGWITLPHWHIIQNLSST